MLSTSQIEIGIYFVFVIQKETRYSLALIRCVLCLEYSSGIIQIGMATCVT